MRLQTLGPVVLAHNDYIQRLGRNFLSTGYVLPTWKTIQSEG
jgi:hypothetical protein